MTEFKIEDIYTALLAIVSNSNAEEPCHRINSLVVVGDKFDFDKDFVAARKINPFYFSRSGNSVAFPALVISEVVDNLSKYKNGRYGKFCHRFEFGILDQAKEKCTNCKPCDKRKDEELYRDTAKLLTNLINEISNIKSYVIKPTNEKVFMPKPLMDALIAAGKYQAASDSMQTSSIINRNFIDNNSSIDIKRIKLQRPNLIGMFAILTICEICYDEPMEYKVRELTDSEKNCC